MTDHATPKDLIAATEAVRDLRAQSRSAMTAAETAAHDRKLAEALSHRKDLAARIPRDAHHSSAELTGVIAVNGRHADGLNDLAALCRVPNDPDFRRRCSHMTEGGRELSQWPDRFHQPGAQRHR
jgi:hypothetical protein